MPEEPARVPPADQLYSILMALGSFISSASEGKRKPANRASASKTLKFLSYIWNYARRRENDILHKFEDLADSLAAIRPALDAADGTGPDWWENEAVPVLRDVWTSLQAVADDWGWEPYLTASLRQATKEERRERFREEYERPIDEAAMVWFREDRAHCPDALWERARRGREAGYKPEMTLDEARSRCAPRSDLYRREAKAPCYGRAYPRLEKDRQERLRRLSRELKAALERMPIEDRQGKRDAPKKERGVTPVPIPDDPAQLPSWLAWLNAEIRRRTTNENYPRLKYKPYPSPTRTCVYDLAALRRAKKEVLARMAATEPSQTPEAPAEPAAHRPPTGNPPLHRAPEAHTATKPKRSTERGEGREKLISALTKHHDYADGGCLNLEPIGNNELARAAEVSTSTASSFFNRAFKGYTKYKALCRYSGRLADALKALNGDFAPHDLYGRRPADEDNRDDE
jgi:hypothetical protein